MISYIYSQTPGGGRVKLGGDQRAVWQRAVSSRQGLNRYKQVYETYRTPIFCTGPLPKVPLVPSNKHTSSADAPSEAEQNIILVVMGLSVVITKYDYN